MYPISVYYGVTKSQTCKDISPLDCRSPATLSCSYDDDSCTVSLFNDISLIDCQGKIANYIGVEYRFIPCMCFLYAIFFSRFINHYNLLVNTVNNFTICDNTDIDASTNKTKYGIITNANYPGWQPNIDCTRKIIAPVGKIIRVYVNDIKIEPPIDNGQ